MSHADCEIAVVGAGIVGTAVTCELARRGAAVTLIAPRPDFGSASAAAGAMLSIFSEIEPDHPPDWTAADVVERLRSDRLWQDWLASLTERGARIRSDAGTWVVGRPDEWRALEAIGSAARRHGQVAEEHRAHEVPGLAGRKRNISTALWLPSESSVDAFDVLTALHECLRGNPSVTWIDATATSMTVADARKTVRTTTGSVRARRVIVAAGAASAALTASAGISLGAAALVGGHGSGLLVRAPNPPRHTIRTANRAFSCGTHLVPRAHGLTYLGSSNRFRRIKSSGATTRTTLDEITVLTDAATSELDESIFEAELISTHAGVRPFTLDRLPLVGPTGDTDILLATATYRSGYMLAPRIAELIADEIQDPGAHRGHPYAVDRRFPVPDTETVLRSGGAGLIEALLEPGGHLPPGVSDRLTTFIVEALRMALADSDDDKMVQALRELWSEVPMAETIPALLRLTQELKGRSAR
ncbi:NAD(P)/FAD-dependent oxidoreductase [Nocardia amamiensis]|uniref:NAD(P)/FAD-dependent oxidoreductase n=1 Tax=Nocardia amamiensis TaxID=404578 RepID=UPI00082C07F5|nr:FAD-binding oxidoreductase [Nocardia amamiensis]